MRLHEILSAMQEMALLRTTKTGTFDGTGNEFDKNDAKLLTNPKNMEKLYSVFSKSKYDFVFHYIENSGISDRNREYGKVSKAETKALLPNVSQELIDEIFSDTSGAITVIHTSNQSSEKMPLTPWVHAHRVFHTIDSTSADIIGVFEQRDMITNFYSKVYSQPVRRDGTKFTNDEHFIFLTSVEDHTVVDQLPYDTLDYIQGLFSNSVGTMLSSRQGKIPHEFHGEFVFECGAQYILSNKLTFENRLDKTLHCGEYDFKLLGDDIVERELNIIKQRMESMYKKVLDDSVGKVFIM
jgi:hypothetical protein